MKVQNFSDSDIFNFLMVSDFNEGLTPDEFKFLLVKFRYFFRMTYGKNESLKIEIDKLLEELNNQSIKNKRDFENIQSEKLKIEKKYDSLLNKKLTWRERIKGKIIIKEDEINRI